MIDKLERLVEEVGALQSKLVLHIGPPNSGKTASLHSLAKSKGVTPLNVGAELGGRLAGTKHLRFRFVAGVQESTVYPGTTSSKALKAQKIGVAVISEDELGRLISVAI